jgi:hypothetical protein
MRNPREVIVLAMTASAVTGQSIPNIKDSMEPLELPEPSFVVNMLPYLAAAVVLGVLIWLRFRSRSRSRAESPAARAQRRLSNIALAAPRAFYTELHRIFVEYLESQVRFKASHCTTPELLRILADAEFISADWRASVEGLLADCDRAKFSSWQPDREPDAVVAECKALINQVATAPLLATGIGRRVNELV